MSEPDLHLEPCSKCRGRGVRFYSRGTPPVACNYCKGVGQRQFKESMEKRLEKRQKVKERRARKLAELVWEFKSAYPEVWIWMETAEGDFAVSLRDGLLKWGGLTDRQLEVALKVSSRKYGKRCLI